MPRQKKDGQSSGLGPKFIGFPKPTSNYFKVPNEFIDLIAEIDNIAELKVVLYVVRHTWGFQEYGIKKKITIDEFAHGRKHKDGSRMDRGTGLAERSVVNGVAKALEHGYLECEVDDSDKGRVKRYFSLVMSPTTEELSRSRPFLLSDMQTMHSGGTEIMDDQNESGMQALHTDSTQEERLFLPSDMQTLHTHSQSLQSNVANTAYQTGGFAYRTEKETLREETLSSDEFVSDEFDFAASTSPSSEMISQKKKPIPAFLRLYIEDFSRKFNDIDQIFSNLRQAANIFYDSGLDQDSFINCMYEAVEITLKARVEKRNGNHINRMPYFFACLRESVNELVAYQSQENQG